MSSISNESKLATNLSYLFHPLFLWTGGVLIFVLQDIGVTLQTVIIVFLLLIVSLGSIYFAFLPFKKEIKTVVIQGLPQKDRLRIRIICMLVLGVMGCMAIVLILSKSAIHLILYFISTLQILLYSFILTYRIKTSAHVTAISALVGVFVSVFSPIFILLIPFIGIVVWARIKMKAHTGIESLTGFIIGFFVSLITFWVGLK